jgi:hypothetical protein
MIQWHRSRGLRRLYAHVAVGVCGPSLLFYGVYVSNNITKLPTIYCMSVILKIYIYLYMYAHTVVYSSLYYVDDM